MAKGSVDGKDPAVLWYWNDWMGGTSTFTRHQKGCYMDLLCAQFNTGPLAIDEIKNVLGSDFGQWPTLRKKFETNVNGLFFNVRLMKEVVKRKGYSKSRRDNLSKKDDDSAPHMGNENGTERGDVLKKKEGDDEIYRAFDHLTISQREVSKLLDNGYSMEEVDRVLDAVANYVGNKKYKSLYLTANTWLRKDRERQGGGTDRHKKDPSNLLEAYTKINERDTSNNRAGSTH